MELQPVELMDKMSILKLKIEKTEDASLKKEYEEYKKALMEFQKKGTHLDPEWLLLLYIANKEQWDIYSELNSEKNKDEIDYEKIGRLYIAVEKSNKKRVAVRNEIVELTGKGFKDIKMN